jgi:glycosyltransferase involved in cell wall biosynthesis
VAAGLRLSIVVPALDEAAGIGTALARLAPLRARGHEVLVVDGGSRDGTAALAAPLADRVLQAPRGRARQMNAGAAAARGEALLFLHADTRLPEDADALVSGALREREWGRFDVRIEGRSRLLPLVARLPGGVRGHVRPALGRTRRAAYRAAHVAAAARLFPRRFAGRPCAALREKGLRPRCWFSRALPSPGA